MCSHFRITDFIQQQYKISPLKFPPRIPKMILSLTIASRATLAFFFFVVLYHEPILITGTADKVTRERHRIHTTTLVQTTAAVFTQKTKITIRPFWIERTHERTSLRDDGSLANESEIVFWYPSRPNIKNELGIVRQRQCAQRCGEREWIDRFRGWVNCEQQLNAGWEKWRWSLCALRKMLNGSFLVLRRWCVEWREKNTGTFCLFVLI